MFIYLEHDHYHGNKQGSGHRPPAQGFTQVILDRAPQHKAKIIRETLRDLDGEVELEFLPPGCPDLSAIEEVWRQMKHAVLDVPYVTVATMHEDIDRWLDSSVLVLDIEKYLCRVI